MPYYPKSQILSNQITNGNEYILATTEEAYKGFYYEVSNGNKYTGKTPNDGPNILLNQSPPPPQQLIQIGYPENSPVIISTTEITNFDIETISPTLPDRNIPQFNPTLPTPQDQQNGQFNRYFCKRTNENRYMEIDFNTYSQLQSQDPKIAWDLYNPTLIIWLIQGNREQVYNSNKGSVQSVEQNLKWYGFSQYFKDDFSKYYLGS
jgi:hypothetical protein